MTVTLKADIVRQVVARTLQEFGDGMDGISDIKETIFLSEGKCLARSYRHGGWMAMWLVEDGIVQFYDSQGNMLRTVGLNDETGQSRMAA